MTRKKSVVYLVGAIILTFAFGLFSYRAVLGHYPWERSRAEIEAACEVHIQNAERRVAVAISERARSFAKFIESKKTGAKPFSEEVVSYKGQWAAIKAKLPRTNVDGHKQYVAEKFSQHLFTSEELERAMKASINGGMSDILRIENELAVELRQEFLGRPLAPSEASKVGTDFNETISTLVMASNAEVVKAAGGMVVSEVTTQVATGVLSRLAVQGGIVSASLANFWWTFGGSVVIGVGAAEVWSWLSKPAETIEQSVVTELDKFSHNGQAAIRDGLNKAIAARGQNWRTKVKATQ